MHSPLAALRERRAAKRERLEQKRSEKPSRRHLIKAKAHAKEKSFDLNPPETARRRHLHRAFYAAIVPVLRPVMKVVYGAKVVKASDEPVPRGAIVVINHVCYFDSVMSAIALWPARLRFLALASNGYGHAWGPLVRAFGTIFVGHTLAQTREMLQRQDEALAAGDDLAIYPEGNLQPYEAQLQDFQRGAFQIAAMHKAPVVPVTLVQAPKRGMKRLWGKPGFEVHIGSAICCPEDMNRHQCAAYLEEQAREAMEFELTRGPVFGKVPQHEVPQLEAPVVQQTNVCQAEEEETFNGFFPA